MTLQFPTGAEQLGRLPHIASLRAPDWPEFLNHDAGVYVEPNVWMVHAPRPATEP